MTLFPNRRGLVIQKYLWPSTDDDEIIRSEEHTSELQSHGKPHIRITLALESIELKLKLSMYPFVK